MEGKGLGDGFRLIHALRRGNRRRLRQAAPLMVYAQLQDYRATGERGREEEGRTRALRQRCLDGVIQSAGHQRNLPAGGAKRGPQVLVEMAIVKVEEAA